MKFGRSRWKSLQIDIGSAAESWHPGTREGHRQKAYEGILNREKFPETKVSPDTKEIIGFKILNIKKVATHRFSDWRDWTILGKKADTFRGQQDLLFRLDNSHIFPFKPHYGQLPKLYRWSCLLLEVRWIQREKLIHNFELVNKLFECWNKI